jgi:hypothetical protein
LVFFQAGIDRKKIHFRLHFRLNFLAYFFIKTNCIMLDCETEGKMLIRYIRNV